MSDYERNGMSILRRGNKGPEVRDLQLQLKALHYYDGDVDGVFGPITERAVIAFQRDHEELEVDGLVGVCTRAALRQAIAEKEPDPEDNDEHTIVEICSDEVWGAFIELRDLIVGTPVRYGPGRGLFVEDHWVVTHGPGKLERRPV